MNFTTHHLIFTAETITPLALDTQSGAAIRGAISNALWDRFCMNKPAPTCADCPLVQVCPVAALVAPMREADEKGGDQRPRPYVIQPPHDGARTYAPGDTLTFGLGVFGTAATLFPYLVMAAHTFEQQGLGQRLPELRYERGRLRLRQIAAHNPLDGTRQILYAVGQPQVQTPALPVGMAEVVAYASTLPTDQLTLRFLTPLRIVEKGQLLQQIALRPLLQRLMRRLDDLGRAYGDGRVELDYHALLAVAEAVRVVDDQTRWVDVTSYSSRQRRHTPIGGLIGHATFAGELAPLRELLVWGSLVHVGKNAVKGDGWYRIEVGTGAKRQGAGQA